MHDMWYVLPAQSMKKKHVLDVTSVAKNNNFLYYNFIFKYVLRFKKITYINCRTVKSQFY